MSSIHSKIKANQERNIELNKSRIKNETDIEFNEFKKIEIPNHHVNPMVALPLKTDLILNTVHRHS